MAASSSLSKNLSVLSQAVDALKISADNNSSAVNALSASVASAGLSSSGSESYAPIVSSVQSLEAVLSAIQGIHQSNSEAISGITEAVRAVEASVKAINAGNSYDIDINQQGFYVGNKNDADLVARNTASALRSGLGNGGV